MGRSVTVAAREIAATGDWRALARLSVSPDVRFVTGAALFGKLSAMGGGGVMERALRVRPLPYGRGSVLRSRFGRVESDTVVHLRRFAGVTMKYMIRQRRILQVR